MPKPGSILGLAGRLAIVAVGACAEPVSPQGASGDGGTGGGSPESCEGCGGQDACGGKCALVVVPSCYAVQCHPESGACVTAPSPQGTECDDELFCTRSDVCDGTGTCSGSPNDCNLVVGECETIACDEVDQTCSPYPATEGAACVSSNPCEIDPTCHDGTCVGMPRDCSFMAVSNPCEVPGSCNPLTGECEAAPGNDGKICDDSDPCTLPGMCSAGTCAGLEIIDCSGYGAGCSSSECDATSGACAPVPLPSGASCPLAEPSDCLVGTCSAGGVCEPNVAVGSPCDASACLSGSCDANASCIHTSVANGTACDDAVACSQTSSCSEGACVGAMGLGCAPIQQIAVGGWHSCAIGSTGSLSCWGWGVFGQTGAGTTSDLLVPGVPGVLGIPTVEKISLGGYHTCAILPDDTVSCWGRNESGQLGRATVSPLEPSPSLVPNLTGVKQVAAGAAHTCALKGTAVVCWGSGTYGQLGPPPLPQPGTPSAPLPLPETKSICSGEYHSCALSNAGSVRCWGYGKNAQLGVAGDGGNSDTPVSIAGLPNIDVIACGGSHTCGLGADGALFCWGWGKWGQLGDGSFSDSPLPIEVSLNEPVIQVSTGSANTCVLLTSGVIFCWGRGSSGQLGDGTTAERATPGPVSHLTGIEQITSGQHHTCALSAGGVLSCWGLNSNGQLGIGSTANVALPSVVTWPGGG